MTDEAYRELIRRLKKEKIKTQAGLNRLKNEISKEYRLRKIPPNTEILFHLSEKEAKRFRGILTTKPSRTISGVAVAAIMTRPFPCPHKTRCIYCPGGVNSAFGNVPQSYTGKEPAARRAIRNRYDPYLQLMNRLEQYVALNQDISKVELIIMGGTFLSFPKKYRDYFVTYAFKAMNDFSKLFFREDGLDFLKFKRFFELPGEIEDKKRTKRIHSKLLKIKNSGKTSLKKEQLKNEKSRVRCVSLVIETRPDYATLKEGNEMLRLGCTKVELGVQTIYNDVLKKIRRGHTVEDSIKATAVLKDLGFKIGYHIMPGLPGVNKEKDLFAMRALFKYEEFQPDMLKLYPCMVLKGTPLYGLWKKKRYAPLTTEQAANLILKFKKTAPEYVRISRVQRDIPTFLTEGGVDMTNLRQYIGQLMGEKKIKCRCIRCREWGHVPGRSRNIRNINEDINYGGYYAGSKKDKINGRINQRINQAKLRKIRILEMHYTASGGSEFFISAEDVKKDILFGFCRLRFPSQLLREEITEDTAIIREIHICSPSVQIGEKSEGSYQHRGLGKMLVRKAEETAKTYYKKKMVVIAGVGAREYFVRLGYKKDGPYMSKVI